MISDKIDITALKSDFDKVLSYSQGVITPQTETIFDNWIKNKEKFFQFFGEKLIYTDGELKTFPLSVEEKDIKLGQFLDKIYDCGEQSLYEFMIKFKEHFYSNILPEEYTFKSELLGEKITIPKGIKIIKAFKFFIRDKEALTYFQDYASRLIQEDKVEGYLCFSIHPLDFLSTSENIYKWRSCHALDGEYRAGNLSYMQDNSTIICYLVSHLEEKHKLPSFPNDILWNSKKWRRLIFFSNDFTLSFAGRPYPYEVQGSLEEISNSLIFQRISESVSLAGVKWSKWSNTSINSIELKYSEDESETLFLDKEYLPVGKKLISIKKLIKDAEYSTHYNDLLYSSCYKPFYTTLLAPNWGEYWYCNSISDATSTKFNIGAPVPCIYCGNEYIPKCQDSMFCETCGENENEDVYYCSCCGRQIRDDEYRWVGNDYMCYECFEENRDKIIQCDRCGQYIFEEDAIIVEEQNEKKYLCRACGWNNSAPNFGFAVNLPF